MATFYNQATLTYNGLSTSSNIATGEIVEVLSATKAAVGGSYTAGDRVTYVYSISNTGAAPYNDLTVTDDLGAYDAAGGQVVPLTYVPGSVLFYVDGVQQPAPTVNAGPPLTFTGVNVPAGSNAQIIYETAVNGYASPEVGGTVRNTATATGAGLINPVTASADITAAPEPELSISKSVSPAVVAENGQLTYTFVIQNTGNTEATVADNAVISDQFTPVLSGISATYNGQPWTEGTNYTYTDGLFTTADGQITVPPASYTQNADGTWTVTPGTATVTVTGTV